MMVDESGYFCVATLIKFNRTEDGKYVFQEAQESKDGGLMIPSIKEMFPSAIAKKAIAAQADDKIGDSMRKQCDVYAEAYLKAIGREAEITSYHNQDFPILTDNGVSVAVSNALYELHPEYSIYVGSFERLENGKRVVYSQWWSDNKIGPVTVTFQKWSDNKIGPVTVTFQKSEYGSGKIVEKYVYKVEGDKFERINID